MSVSSSPSCRQPLPLQERPRGMLTYLDRPGITPPAEPRPLPEPPPPTPTPLSFHPLPSPLPPAPARRRHGSRPSTGRLCRAGPDFLHSSQHSRRCIAKRRRRRFGGGGGGGGGGGPRLRPCLCNPAPCRARKCPRGRRRGSRGRRPAKLIKVYTWFAHWCAAGKKCLLKVRLSV